MTISRWLPLAVVGLALAAPGCKPANKSARAPMQRAEAEASDGAKAEDESITNTQEANVDEGGIVKAHGDHLVVLRRGRLFTVHVGDDALRPISYVDVTPHPSHDAWYDEMLIHEDTIVTVGFSYRVGATELGLFRIDDEGALTYVDTWFLASNDYYSARNYASRLVGDQLIFYMPHYVGPKHDSAPMPRVGRWRGGDRRTRKHGDWSRLMQSAQIIPSIETTRPDILHSVVTCDLRAESLGCRARGIMGGYGRTFHVSSSAVYVWTFDPDSYGSDELPGALYRLPLTEGPVGAVHVEGGPIDQFSFKETEGHLNVVLAREPRGDAMWGPEAVAPDSDMSLLRVPLSLFDERGRTAPRSAYRDLPDVKERHVASLHNRFVGDRLLYGAGNGWGYVREDDEASLFVHHFADPAAPTEELRLAHGVDRIEALGRDGLVVGSDGKDLHFTSLRLEKNAKIAGRFIQDEASQGELRSHGFFFKPTGEGQGMLGLPLRRWDAGGYSFLFQGSAEILYLDVDDLRLSEMGTLVSRPRRAVRDACITSCVDWYGNARPIFYRGRVFALLGYELVEGRVVDGRIEETRRVDMSGLIWGGGLRHVG